MVFNTFFLLFTEVRGGEPHFKDSRLPDVWIVSSYMYKFYLPLLKKSLDSELQQRFVVLCFVLCFFCVVFCAVPEMQLVCDMQPFWFGFIWAYGQFDGN